MKNIKDKLIKACVIILPVLILWVCVDTTSPIEDNISRVNDNLYKVNDRPHCCDGSFPNSAYSENTSSGFDYCETHGSCTTTVPYCAHLWSQEVSSSGGSLGNGYCKDDCPEVPPPPDDCYVERTGDTAYIYWDFVYCHYYLVYKKIGIESWNLLSTRDNCLSYQNCGSNNMTDDVTGQSNIYYKVKSKNYSTPSSTYSSTGYCE
jgi:hypothetical protein